MIKIIKVKNNILGMEIEYSLIFEDFGLTKKNCDLFFICTLVSHDRDQGHKS